MNILTKKLSSLLLVLLLLLSLVGCNSKKEENTNTTVSNNNGVQEVVKEETKQETVTTLEVKEKVKVEEVVKEEKVDVTELSYWVNFLNPDGTVLSRKAYKYGSKPLAPENPTYFDGVAYYVFKGWNKVLSSVYGTQTYLAEYDITGYVEKEEDNTPVPTPVETPVEQPKAPTLEDALSDDNTFTLKFSFKPSEGTYTKYMFSYLRENGGFRTVLLKGDVFGETSDNIIDSQDFTEEFGLVFTVSTSPDGTLMYFVMQDYGIVFNTVTNTYGLDRFFTSQIQKESFKIEINDTEVNLIQSIGHYYGKRAPLSYVDFTPSEDTTIGYLVENNIQLSLVHEGETYYGTIASHYDEENDSYEYFVNFTNSNGDTVEAVLNKDGESSSTSLISDFIYLLSIDFS